MYEHNAQVLRDALRRVQAIHGISFCRSDSMHVVRAGLRIGEVRDTLPEAVTEDGYGQPAIDPMALVGLLVEAVKELDCRLAQATADIESLRKKQSTPKK